MAKLTEEDYVEMADVVDDLKAGIQVVDSVGQLIEDSKTEVERVIESEFSAIFTQLEERETALLERAKAISDSKLSALAAHEAKLEKAMGALPGGAGATADEAALAQCAVEPRETLELALSDDPVFHAESEERMREMVEAFGTVGDTGGLQVSPMLDAVVSFPRCKGFFAAVLHLMASMPADDSSGLVEEEDIELLVAMLDEYKMPSVIERACMAICNIAGQNSALSERVGAEGGVTMLLGWLVDEEILAQPDTIAAICLAIGLLADAPANERIVHESDGAAQLLAVMQRLSSSVPVQENAMFALGTLAKYTTDGRAAVLEAGAIDAIAQGLTQYVGELAYLEKAMRALYYLGGRDLEKSQMVAAGIPAALASILREHSAGRQVVEGVCGVISMLLQDGGAAQQPEAGGGGAGEGARARAREALDALADGEVFSLLLAALGAFSTEVELNRVILGIFSNFGLLAGKDRDLVRRAGFIADAATGGEGGGGGGDSGVQRIVAAMRMHSRSMEIMESGCNAIWCLAKAEPALKAHIRASGAIQLILQGLGSFAHAAEFCATACAALWCLSFKDAHNKTLIGGLDGVATILKAMEAHPTEAMCEHGNIAVANVVATHRVNRRLAGQAGAIELVLRMLADHVDTSVVSFTACNALIALTQDEPCNKVSYARAGGPRVVAAVAETHAGNATIAPLAHHLQSYGSSAEIIGREGGQGDAEMAAAGLGQDAVALYAKGSGGAQRLRAVTSARQRSRCYRQQIIKFSAAGKDPKKISKWRLAALDAVDVIIYGGEDDQKADNFSRQLHYYPLAKLTSCRVVPNFKSALTFTNLDGETGTIVCDSKADAKEWVAAIEAHLSSKNGKAKLVDKSKKTEYFLSCVAEFLFVYETSKGGSLVEVIPAVNMATTYSERSTVVLTTAAHTYTFMTGTSAEAVSWETHFLGMISSVNSRLEELSAIIRADREASQPEPEPEPEPAAEATTESVGMRSAQSEQADAAAAAAAADAAEAAQAEAEGEAEEAEYTAEMVAELEQMLADAQLHIAKEGSRKEDLDKRLASTLAARKKAESRLNRVVEEIRKQKAIKAGTYDDSAALDTTSYSKKNFMARFAKFESIASMAADSSADSVRAGQSQG